MKLHIFNPEHDLALAANLSNFTAPLAGRALRNELSYLPAFWADEDDVVLTDDPNFAERQFKNVAVQLDIKCPQPQFVTKNSLNALPVSSVEPWGWDLAIRGELLRAGLCEALLPSVDEIEEIRQLSHRRHTTWMLDEIDVPHTVGQSWCCSTIDEIREIMFRHHDIVLKAPWSSTGRGVRMAHGTLEQPLCRWINRLFETQGSVMVEPYYNKICDFGMEFYSDGDGQVAYCGLSLFSTVNGAYTGNLLMSEENKEETISRYISLETLQSVQERIISLTGEMYQGKYRGLFGVDMMIVCQDDGSYGLHPCVEINLRRTMGHVALAMKKYIKKGRLTIYGKPHSFSLMLEHSV